MSSTGIEKRLKKIERAIEIDYRSLACRIRSWRWIRIFVVGPEYRNGNIDSFIPIVHYGTSSSLFSYLISSSFLRSSLLFSFSCSFFLFLLPFLLRLLLLPIRPLPTDPCKVLITYKVLIRAL